VGLRGGLDLMEKRMELGVGSVIQKVTTSKVKWKSHIKRIPEERK
jgi:hypothetical protein